MKLPSSTSCLVHDFTRGSLVVVITLSKIFDVQAVKEFHVVDQPISFVKKEEFDKK